ncbi:4'-phosphopantetheinyl transferase family protein [Paenibacillus sp. MBLB4367]|uniref:4'-phosphopantetheinyl transferase family protein n=1 Tax=Paenibacillus sp. MBLB4367 TaxID=3384767 RepID=UPI003907E828
MRCHQSPSGFAGIDLWYGRLEDLRPECARYAAVLSPDERRRAARYIMPSKRREFVLARGWLRHVLSSYTGIPPGRLRFRYGPSGKPSLVQQAGHAAKRLEFNISHSGSHLLLAVTRGRRVGADLETIRPIQGIWWIADRYFSEAQQKFLRDTDGVEALRLFFREWTMLEAEGKCHGSGLAGAGRAGRKRSGGYRYRWEPEPGRLAAICTDGAPCRLRRRNPFGGRGRGRC